MWKKLMFPIVTTIATVCLWIGLEVFIGLTSESIETDYQNYTESITPTLNTELIDKVEDLEEEYLLVDRDWLD